MDSHLSLHMPNCLLKRGGGGGGDSEKAELWTGSLTDYGLEYIELYVKLLYSYGSKPRFAVFELGTAQESCLLVGLPPSTQCALW